MQGEFPPGSPERIRSDLTQQLRRRWEASPVEVGRLEPFGDGHSGFTFETTISARGDSFRAVLRLSPPGVRISGPADVGRQGRIMAALAETDVPVPRVFAMSSEPVIDGRSFALTELVSSVSWSAAARDTSPQAVAQQAVSVLHALRAVSREASGIAATAPLSAAEEIGRWAALLARCPDWLAGPAGTLRAELAAAAPDRGRTSLGHGDFHLGNLLFRDGRVAAVIDWEVASVGDPLFDLGSLIVSSIRRRYPDDPNPTGGLALPLTLFLDLYGTSADEANWYVAASCFKYAAILGYNLGLHRSGRRPDPIYERLTTTMSGLIDDGRAVLHDGLQALPPADR